MTFSISNLQFAIGDRTSTGLQIENCKSKIENGLNLRLGDEGIAIFKLLVDWPYAD